MRKRVAVFANGWSDEYLMNALEGIRKCASEENIEIHLFIEYVSVGDDDKVAQGFLNILNLPDIATYDGVVLLGNTLNNRGELQILRERILNCGIPTVCLEYQVDGIDCICTDNYSGMRQLCEHLVTEHNVKKVAFISGDNVNWENKERRRAVEDVLREHGLDLTDDDVIHGGWSYYEVQENLPGWVEKHGLPDVFICANDVMAMGAVITLGTLGYIVPDDVLVTGFDNINAGKSFIPVITTVDRGWKERSYNGMCHLVELMNGKEPYGGTIFYPSTLVVGESCGCVATKEEKRAHLGYINSSFLQPALKTRFGWHLATIDEVTNDEVKNLEDLNKNFKFIFRNAGEKFYHNYEGHTFCICLDDAFVDSIMENTPCRCIGYGKRTHVIYTLKDDVSLPIQTIDTSYIFPVLDTPEEVAPIYLIVPIHDKGLNIGYCVFKNHLELLNMYFLEDWIKHIAKCMIRTRIFIRMELMNQKLQEYSFVDELSGLLNRKGYEHKAIPYLEKIRSEGKSGVLMVVDINKMKTINDKYGHLQGDLAIRIVSMAISSVLPENWYGVRYGGDEFVVLGEKIFVDNGSILEKQLCDAVKKIASNMMIPFELTVSIGSVIISPNDKVMLDEYFKVADTAMYEMKKSREVNMCNIGKGLPQKFIF